MIFITPRIGWILGPVQLLQTLDGGRNWKDRYSNLRQRRFAPFRISAAEKDTVWLLSLDASNRFRCNVTFDSGSAWEKKYEAPGGPYVDLFALKNTERVWILSGAGVGDWLLHQTSDYGGHWDRIPLPFKGEAKKVVFADHKHGWILQTYNEYTPGHPKTSVLYFTSDGGATWTPKVEVKERVENLCLIDRKQMFLVGREGCMLRSMDAGESWIRVSIPRKMTLTDVAFRGPIGLAVGSSDIIRSTRDVLILHSKNQGETWHRIPFPIAKAVSRVHLTSWDQGVMLTSERVYGFKLRSDS